MSHNVNRDTMNKLKRSNSHENIPLRPMTGLIHATPIMSYGADQTSFGVRDDSSLMSSSSDHVVSSPYENASSVLAVSKSITISILLLLLLLLFVYVHH
jgi:hypothetical protein